MEKSPADKRGFWASFGVRTLAALVMLPLFILTAIYGGLYFLLLLVLPASLLLLREYSNLLAAKGVRGTFSLLILPVLALLLAFYFGGLQAGAILFGVMTLLLMSAEAMSGHIDGAWFRVGSRLLGLFYVGWLPGHWLLLRGLAEAEGFDARVAGLWVLFGAVVTWLCDTGAYLVGSLIGRHPLGSPVSPRKTIEGSVGGTVAAVLAAWLLSNVWMPFLATWQALLIGLLLALATQLGDLFESLLKRDAARKDSGQAIPGHGGFLDRLDSLLFTLPLLYYFLVSAIF